MPNYSDLDDQTCGVFKACMVLVLRRISGYEVKQAFESASRSTMRGLLEIYRRNLYNAMTIDRETDLDWARVEDFLDHLKK